MARTPTGDAIVDFYADLAFDEKQPIEVRRQARERLTAFALRDPEQTVEDIEGKPN